MNYLFPIISSFLLLFLLPEKTATDHELLKNLLYDFLEGASVNDYDVHNRFWADDLIYTSAAGERIGKQDIMSGLTVGNTDTNGNFPQYYADEIQINIYGEAAVVAFILVADIPLEPSGNEQLLFYNTGTFLKRDGEWRAVAWQATRIPD
ncbi:MAG: nuclear transport factor 2 family protein [Balneolaceae bacterium]|nr:MAG: nuclear transport factor 2 family protein [Balneolaceae bacterium]